MTKNTLVFILLSLFPSLAQEVWSDATGRKTSMKLIGTDGILWAFETPRGRKFSIPLARLAPADQLRALREAPLFLRAPAPTVRAAPVPVATAPAEAKRLKSQFAGPKRYQGTEYNRQQSRQRTSEAFAASAQRNADYYAKRDAERLATMALAKENWRAMVFVQGDGALSDRSERERAAIIKYSTSQVWQDSLAKRLKPKVAELRAELLNKEFAEKNKSQATGGDKKVEDLEKEIQRLAEELKKIKK